MYKTIQRDFKQNHRSSLLITADISMLIIFHHLDF